MFNIEHSIHFFYKIHFLYRHRGLWLLCTEYSVLKYLRIIGGYIAILKSLRSFKLNTQKEEDEMRVQEVILEQEKRYMLIDDEGIIITIYNLKYKYL